MRDPHFWIPLIHFFYPADPAPPTGSLPSGSRLSVLSYPADPVPPSSCPRPTNRSRPVHPTNSAAPGITSTRYNHRKAFPLNDLQSFTE